MYTPGDFILTHGTGPLDWAIHAGQRLRYPAKYARWNHAALIIDEAGTIVEAEGTGVRTSPIASHKDFVVVSIDGHGVDVSPWDRAKACAFAKSHVGDRYGFLTIVSVALKLATGSSLSFGLDGTEICSGLVAAALTRAGFDFDRDPFDMTPADLAAFFLVGG